MPLTLPAARGGPFREQLYGMHWLLHIAEADGLCHEASSGCESPQHTDANPDSKGLHAGVNSPGGRAGAAIAVKPKRVSHVHCGTAGGGILASKDGGSVARSSAVAVLRLPWI